MTKLTNGHLELAEDNLFVDFCHNAYVAYCEYKSNKGFQFVDYETYFSDNFANLNKSFEQLIKDGDIK